MNKKNYSFEYSDEFIYISNNKGELLRSPLSATLTLESGTICEACGEPEIFDNKVVLAYKNLPDELSSATLTLELNDDEIILNFETVAKTDTSINTLEYFLKGKKAIAPNSNCFFFSPAPRSAAGHGTTLYKRPCDVSTDAYFAPPPFIMVMGNRFGNIAYSLLDMPNSKQFKFTPNFGVLVEAVGGNIKLSAGEKYTAPRLMLTFPQDEWNAMEDYYERLKSHNRINPIPIEKKSFPEWWKRFVVDSYGDQIVQLQYNAYVADDWASPDYNTSWLYKWLDTAVKRLGRSDFNIVIDAFWQYEFSIDPIPDKNRFLDLRKFIDDAHKRGHKVLLWIVPFFADSKKHLSDGELTWAQRYDILNSANQIDWTSDNIKAYLNDYCNVLFGSDDGCLDADGVKIDGPQLSTNPTSFKYAHPEHGCGVCELIRFYKLFTNAAQKVKPDVLINSSVVNPFFENEMHICRLGDQSVRSEREDRARISSIMSPNMLMDSDAVTDSELLKEDYLAACVYSVPYLYYTDEFMYGPRPDDKTMKQLGNLLSLSEKKPYGRAIFESQGNWRWETCGKTTAACFDYNTIIVFSEDGTGYVFSWKDGIKRLPLFDWKLVDNPDAAEIEISLTAGEISTFKFK